MDDYPYRFGTDGGADLRAAMIKCVLCHSRKPVYFIDEPNQYFKEPGAYCYKCLLSISAASGCIPFPIGTDLLDKLKHDIEVIRGTKIKRIF